MPGAAIPHRSQLAIPKVLTPTPAHAAVHQTHAAPALVLIALAAGGRAYLARGQPSLVRPSVRAARGRRPPSKNGILIVELANQLRSRGYDSMTAAQEAAALRLRPILMTTSAMILGTLPLALAGGPGAGIRAPIGWVIVGGLCFGTLLTLFVIPMAYTLPARRVRATGAEAYEPSPAPGPAAPADRFRSPQSRR
jgi:hypothetical protein